MYEKLTKCPNFTWYLTEKYFFRIFLEGGEQMPPCPPSTPVSYAYVWMWVQVHFIGFAITLYSCHLKASFHCITSRNSQTDRQSVVIYSWCCYCVAVKAYRHLMTKMTSGDCSFVGFRHFYLCIYWYSSEICQNLLLVFYLCQRGHVSASVSSLACLSWNKKFYEISWNFWSGRSFEKK